MNTKLRIKYFFLLFFFTIVLVDFSFSQGPPPAPACDEPPCAPIPLDGGVCFLIFAGAAYGVIKIYKFKQRSLN